MVQKNDLNESRFILPGQGLPGGEQQNEFPSTHTQSVIDSDRNRIYSGEDASSSSALLPVVPSYPVDENNHKYVGLVNQAMTCYLNSLVQSLYMTPEFRNAMYEWEYVLTNRAKGKKGESSIPCQLQKLFLLLQTTENDSLETKELTASFGWSASEAYDQHDVQELCRLMFDALEQKWKSTKHEKLIQDLYRGTMEDFVTCLKCGKENVKLDYFLDLPLAVKPFGALKSFKSVEEALHGFIQPELLDESNKYNCENCQSKQKAHKGLRITQFPYLLTIQLKRFDFDYTTMHRIKLNDRMTFPDVLNLNSFVCSKSKNDDDMDIESVDDAEISSLSNDEHNPVTIGSPIDKKYVDELLKQGEYVYELFSIMVHAGSASGGHYFAYIKNLEQDKWYSFNDTRVDFASVSEIESTFGGQAGAWSSSNTNAYMLMYRKIDRKRNCGFIHTKNLPPHIKTLQRNWKLYEKEEREKRALRESLVTVNITLNCNISSFDNRNDLNSLYTSEMPRTESIRYVFEQAFDHFIKMCRKNDVNRRMCRLIAFDGQNLHKSFVEYNEMDTYTLSDVYRYMHPMHSNPHTLANIRFLFDINTKSDFFPVDQSGSIVNIQRINIAERTVKPNYYIHVPFETNLLNMKKLIAGQFMDDVYELFDARFVLNCLTKKEFLLIDKGMNLKKFHDLKREFIGNGLATIYYDGGLKLEAFDLSERTTEDRKLLFEKSLMRDILDRKHFSMIVKVYFPPKDEIDRAIRDNLNDSEPMDIKDFNSSIDKLSLLKRNPMRVEEEPIDTIDELDVSSSPCPNTPQVSPCISEGDVSDKPSPSVNFMINRNLCDTEVFTDSNKFKSYHNENTLTGSNRLEEKLYIVSEHENFKCIDIDSRTSVAEVKQWIAAHINVSVNKFVILKHSSNDALDPGNEPSVSDSESFENVFQSCPISIKLRPPLEKDEKLIQVLRFDIKENKRDNWKVLFELAATETMELDDFLGKCLKKYNDIFGENLTASRVRLWDIPENGPGKLLSGVDIMKNRDAIWYSNIFIQIIPDENVGKPGVPIFVRRFYPSTVEVTDTHEILVDTTGENIIVSLYEAISSYSKIPVVSISINELNGYAWAKWPFQKGKIELLDGKITFVNLAEIKSRGENFNLSKIGVRVVYYKNSTEVAKKLSQDEKKQITIKEAGMEMTYASRRKERPLRIQISSVSADD